MDAPNEIVVGNMAGNRSLMLKTFNFPDIGKNVCFIII